METSTGGGIQQRPEGCVQKSEETKTRVRGRGELVLGGGNCLYKAEKQARSMLKDTV